MLKIFFKVLFIFWPYRVACKILIPWPGIKPMPPDVKPPWTTREFPEYAFVETHRTVYGKGWI